MARRALVILLLFFKLSNNSGISLMILLYSQLFYTLMIGLLKPY